MASFKGCDTLAIMQSIIDANPIVVSVIILTKNGVKYLRSLLEELYNQRGVGQAEVIIIDSGSSDGSLDVIADFPDVILHKILSADFGHGKTRNLGARLARGEYLAYLPQDATPAGPDWLANLLRPFDNARVVGVYGRQIARADASSMESFFLSLTYHDRMEIKALSEGEGASLARCFFSTVSGAIRASTWKKHPFREDIIMSEDQAWASEVMRCGDAIAYEPGAKVLHSHQYSIAAIFRRNFDSGYSMRQIFLGVTGITPEGALANLASEVIFVARHGSVLDWLRLVPYEIARHSGFWLGLRADRLPVGLNRLCSDLKYFWDQGDCPKGTRR